MKRSFVLAGFVVVAAASYALGAGTSKPLVAAYESVADVILGAKHAESAVVAAILESHRGHAAAAAAAGKWGEAAAEVALFANEGDNAVGGVRKRLLEGGHHHNAEGEAKGIYEPGYVIVTIEAKKAALDVAARLQAGGDDAARKAAMAEFERVAAGLLAAK
jgi:hypothetical protein